MRVFGIDVSHHQGRIDWRRVLAAAEPPRFAYIKASEGARSIDPQFERNWKATRDAELLHGAYHFARPGENPLAQASHFAGVIGPGAGNELPPVLDLEVSGGLSARDCVQWTLAFVSHAESLLGRSIAIYTGGFWRFTLGDPDAPELTSKPLWIARYAQEEPPLPRPWATWTFWQFSDGQSGPGRAVPGVRGPCDCNWFQGSYRDLEALASPQPSGERPAAGAHAEPGGEGTGPAPRWPGRYLTWPHSPLMRGEDVQAWQVAAAKHVVVNTDGVYGRGSKHACIALQRELGLEPDGIVGPVTWARTFEGGHVLERRTG